MRIKILQWRHFLLVWLIALNAFSVSAEEAKQDDILYFGIVPQQAATRLAEQWVPLIRYLEKQTGKKVVFRTARDIPTFEQRLLEGAYDFSYMNPYHYTVFHDRVGYNALAKARDKKLHGIFVIRNDSGIESLEQLKGSELAFPSPAAFAASIITRAELSNRGIEFSPKYVSSHDSVYRAVAAGLYPAGGGVIRTFKNLDEKIRNQLTILWTSPGSTPHAIAHHPRVELSVVESVAKALLALETAAEGVGILEKLKIKGFIRASNDDWNDVRALNVTIPIVLNQ